MTATAARRAARLRAAPWRRAVRRAAARPRRGSHPAQRARPRHALPRLRHRRPRRARPRARRAAPTCRCAASPACNSSPPTSSAARTAARCSTTPARRCWPAARRCAPRPNALAQIDAAPAGERAARLRALVRAHPEWALARAGSRRSRRARRATSGSRSSTTRRSCPGRPWRAPTPTSSSATDRRARVFSVGHRCSSGPTAPRSNAASAWTVRALRGQNASSRADHGDLGRARRRSRRRRACASWSRSPAARSC